MIRANYMPMNKIKKGHGNGPGYVTLTIYCPAEVKELIKKAAAADDRSVSNWVVKNCKPAALAQLGG